MPEVSEMIRCAICGWPLWEDVKQGCVRGNCSQRPLPPVFYDFDRACSEYGKQFDANRRPTQFRQGAGAGTDYAKAAREIARLFLAPGSEQESEVVQILQQFFPSQERWVAVSKRLPEKTQYPLSKNTAHFSDRVLIHRNGAVWLGYFDTEKQEWNSISEPKVGLIVTHWQPLPKPPEQGEAKEKP